MIKILPLILFLLNIPFSYAGQESLHKTIQKDLFFCEESDSDPLEPLNRFSYAIHSCADIVLLKPLSIAYRLILPPPIRTGIGNALANLSTPVTTLNHLLQGQPLRARTSLTRFLINTTIGIGGLFDPAQDMGFKGIDTGFAETLGVWGVKTGSYLFIPIIGPSSLRGVIGMGANYYTTPVYYVSNKRHHNEWISYTFLGTGLIHQRQLILEDLDDLEATSLDPYAILRSIYFQKEDYKIQKLK